MRQTEAIFARFGPASMLFAKFIPGFASVSTALAGAMNLRYWKFVVFDLLGALLWAGVAIGLGYVFRDAISEMLETLQSLGKWGLVLVATALGAWIATKWWQRFLFIRQLRMDRVTVDELKAMLDTDEVGMILDVRSPMSQAASGRIPRARAIDMERIAEGLHGIEVEGEVVVYCACPNEASAVKVAEKLPRPRLQARAAAPGRHRRVDRRRARRRALTAALPRARFVRSSTERHAMSNEAIHSKHAPAALGPYSQAMRAGNTVYLSGQIGLDPATGNLVEGVEAQTHQVFKNLRAVAQAAGGELADIVKLTIMLADLADFAKVNEIMATYFKAPYPARATYQVAALPKGARIEVEAYRRSGGVAAGRPCPRRAFGRPSARSLQSCSTPTITLLALSGRAGLDFKSRVRSPAMR